MDNGETVADLLVGVVNFIKYIFWFMFYPPIALWNKNDIWCLHKYSCLPTSKVFSLFAWFMFFVLFARIVSISEEMKIGKMVSLILIAGIYTSLPSIYDAFDVIEQRAAKIERQKRGY